MHFFGTTPAALARWLESCGENPQRARDIFIQYYARRRPLAQLEGISKRLKERLGAHFDTRPLEIAACHVARDGTRKYLLRGADGQGFEAVYIPQVASGAGTNTLCVSSQTGCAVGCKFCFTATLKPWRDLATHEIVGQVLAVQEDVARAMGPSGRISNIVFMGMGEPLFNYDAVVQAVTILLYPEGLAFSRRRITISTAGVAPRLADLSRDAPTLLAVSLNASCDAVRDVIMPINKKWPLATLLAAMHTYQRRRRERITVEYVLLSEINDTPVDAARLVELVRDLPVKINLLPLNPHGATPYRAPPPERVAQFQAALWRAGLSAIVRSRRGDDIRAACGQLGGDRPAPSPGLHAHT